MKMKIYEAKSPLNIIMRGIDSVENLVEKFVFKEHLRGLLFIILFHSLLFRILNAK